MHFFRDSAGFSGGTLRTRGKVRSESADWKWLVAIVLTIVYIAIGSDLKAQQSWGMDVILFLQRFRSKPTDWAMWLCGLVGFELLFAVIPALVWWGRPKLQFVGLTLLIGVSYAITFVSVGQLVFHENRPMFDNILIERSKTPVLGYSFPSGHAWATTFCWLFFIFRWHRDTFLPYVGAVLLCLTSLSRVYFGRHYPHDEIAGACAGGVMFIFRKLFAVFGSDAEHIGRDTRQNRQLYFAVQVVMLVFVVAVTFTFEHADRDRQPGFFWAVGCILGCLVSRSFIRPFDLASETVRQFAANFALRFAVGFAPVGAFVFVMRRLYTDVDNTEIEIPLFVGGLLLSVWVVLLGPRLFVALGAARLRSSFHESSGGGLITVATDAHSAPVVVAAGISRASKDDLLYDHLMNRASANDLRGYIPPPSAPVVPSLIDYRYQQARQAGLLPAAEPKQHVTESEAPLSVAQAAQQAASERQGPESMGHASRRTVRPQTSFDSSVYHDL